MCEHTGLVAVRLLDTSGGGSGLASGLGGELLTGSLATSGLTCKREVRLVYCCESKNEGGETRRRVFGFTTPKESSDHAMWSAFSCRGG